MDFNDELEGTGYGRPASSRSNSRPPQRARFQAPQETVKQFWEQFNTKYPGRVYTVLPDNPYARTRAQNVPTGVIRGQEAVKSYEQARRECVRSVERIVKECERLNQKYTDPHFDIEVDLKSGRRNYLDGLGKKNDAMRPRGVKRVTEIFENPRFYVNGPTASDVRQGRDGDCWVMAALCTLGNKEGLIENICVARNENVGIYGFVFYRDGEWQQCIVDDKLYLRAADYDESMDERPIWDDINRTDTEEEYRRAWQTGSRALYFAQCVDENETWLPLLEKAFAKAHGDYSAIEGGFVGEAIEDLTGGVTSEILPSNILDKERFWNEELMKVNKEFLFGCGTGFFSNWLDPKYRGPPRDRKGIETNHSYSIMEAREVEGHRLLRLRNPWGKKEWHGAWGDGSEQWTPEWMKLLGHKFGNDGFFWISYNDLLKKYQHLDRTRLFGTEWTITQQWTTLNVPWSADYHSTKFRLDVTTGGPVVIVLSQLDSRYFRGLAGEYDFMLKFRLQRDGEEDYMVRSHSSQFMSRSVNAEIDLEPGRYHVLMKITAFRHDDLESTEEILRRMASTRREKLVQIGLSYDLAHAKGLIADTEQEKRDNAARKAAERKRLAAETKKRLQKEWIREQKMAARQQRMAARRSGLAAAGSGGRLGRSPERMPEQILNDGPVHQSPTDAASISSDGSDRRVSITAGGSVPTIQLNGSHTRRYVRRMTETSPRPSLDTRFAMDGLDPSDLELLEGFEFDTDLDMPPEGIAYPKSPRPSPGPDLDENAADPWNAVCVVGLRVYSQDPQLSLEVIHPSPEDDMEAPLDRDDPAAASATTEKHLWSSRVTGRIVTRPLGQSPPKQEQPSQGPNVILYLPPGPLFQDSGDRSTRFDLFARFKRHQAQENGSPNSTSPSPQHVLASLTSATVVTVNYRLGTMEPLDNSSKAAKLEQNADNLQKSITNDQLIDKSSFYQYPTPVHDTLAGFDWIRNNLQPEQLGVFGTHVGGSLALMLALTEAQLVRAVTALEPVCDWPGLDEYCISEDSPETQPKSSTDESTGSDSFSLTSAMKQKRPSKRKGFRGAVAPPDLVPLLDAREQFFARPEKYFDAFASPVLFLRSAGRDVPRAFPQYLTGPEYPIPTIKSAAKPIPAENYSALNGSLWDRDVYPDVDIGSEDSDISETSSGPVIRRRKAMSRWPPYGLDYGLSGSALSGPSHGIGRLQMTLPWVRIFLPDGSLSSLVSLHNSRRTKTKETETEVTILARQAEEMVSVMQRACFWGQEKGVGERRVTLSAVPISDADGTVELDEVGIWLKDALDGSMEK